MHGQTKEQKYKSWKRHDKLEIQSSIYLKSSKDWPLSSGSYNEILNPG